MQSEIEKIEKEYASLLSSQEFDVNALDYSVLDNHKQMLQQLSKVGNSGITVFDHCRLEHVFTSYNFESLFGHDLTEIEKQGTEYFSSRIHPDDYFELMRNGVALLKFFYQLPKETRTDYKLITEYRILNREREYIRVVEQHQVLETDAAGNIWLVIGILDISPNQDEISGIKCQMINYKTGKIVPFIEGVGTDPNKDLILSNREKEILQLVKDGLLSKEISDKLSISIHTVNTHRQHILEKLGADNSMEAISYASKLGLLS